MSHKEAQPMTLRPLKLLPFLLLAPALALAAPKGDAEAGKTKAIVCQACHGPDGNADVDPQYPRLTGQYEDYLFRVLQDYKNGNRDNAIMAGFVATLSEQDMADLAAFYARMPDGRLVDLDGRL